MLGVAVLENMVLWLALAVATAMPSPFCSETLRRLGSTCKCVRMNL